MKKLNGLEIADYMKENQAHTVKVLRSNKIRPKLVIIRDNASPVIAKYVALKQQYGADIGVEVEDWLRDDIRAAIQEANADNSVHGIIVQLPLNDMSEIDAIVAEITPEKDVDGLASNNRAKEKVVFESATATAVNWLLAGYDVDLAQSRIAVVGRGRLVGRPLIRMWQNSGYDVTAFGHDSDLAELKNYRVIVSATGVPHLIKSEMVAPGTTVVDAGTASEGGVLVGDVDKSVRLRKDLAAITPKVGGVGPLTVTALFEHVQRAALSQIHD